MWLTEPPHCVQGRWPHSRDWEGSEGAFWCWNSLGHGPQQLPSLLYGWDRVEEHGERNVKAHSVPSVHLQQMFPKEHCPTGSAHSSPQAALDSDDPCTKFSGKPQVVPSCAQKTPNLQSLGFHFLSYRGDCLMDQAITHYDLLCHVKLGNVFPGCIWITAGHMGRGFLGL